MAVQSDGKRIGRDALVLIYIGQVMFYAWHVLCLGLPLAVAKRGPCGPTKSVPRRRVDLVTCIGTLWSAAGVVTNAYAVIRKFFMRIALRFAIVALVATIGFPVLGPVELLVFDIVYAAMMIWLIAQIMDAFFDCLFNGFVAGPG